MSAYIRFRPNPITDYLTENWELIRDEFIAQRKARMGHNLLEVQNESNKLNYVSSIRKEKLFDGRIVAAALYVKPEVLTIPEAKQMNWQPDEVERRWNDNIEQMPTIKKWFDTYKEHLASVVFYAAQPGSVINHHFGVDSTRYNFRMHLCLTGDPECKFNIENEIYTWVPGDLFAFDDAMYFHGIKHRGTQPRIILAVDIKKSAIQEFAINFVERPFIPVAQKPFPVIHEW
jgi:hypothetical protein